MEIIGHRYINLIDGSKETKQKDKKLINKEKVFLPFPKFLYLFPGNDGFPLN